MYTSFITVTLSAPVSDWLSPGNYDPVIAHVVAQTEYAAISKARARSPLRVDLRRRGDRCLRQQLKMEPRGHRIPCWDKSGSGQRPSLWQGTDTALLNTLGTDNNTNAVE